jgi:hypothetical protein
MKNKIWKKWWFWTLFVVALVIIIPLVLYFVFMASVGGIAPRTTDTPCTVVYDKGGYVGDSCLSALGPGHFCVPEEREANLYSEEVRSGKRVEGHGYCKRQRSGGGWGI